MEGSAQLAELRLVKVQIAVNIGPQKAQLGRLRTDGVHLPDMLRKFSNVLDTKDCFSAQCLPGAQ